MLAHIWKFVRTDDRVSVSNIFEQYEDIDMGFICNTDEELVLIDGETKIELLGWSLLDTAVALKAQKIVNWLLKRPSTCVYSRVDLSIADMELRSPNVVDCSEIDVIEIEIRPLFAALVTKQYKLLNKLWRRNQTWEACHFYRLIEVILKRKDMLALQKLFDPQNHYINHFFKGAEI